MKTSNKLLLSFVGLIVLLMLLSDTVMWANYKRGKSGDGDLKADEHFANVQKIPVGAFRVVQIDGKVNEKQQVVKGEKYQLSFYGESKQQFLYSIQNDTMFIKLGDGDDFTLECPDLKTVILTEDVGVALRNFDLPYLNIIADKSCEIELMDSKIKVLDVKGGEENEFLAGGITSNIDSIHLQLGKSGTIRSYDVSYGRVYMDVDSLKELQLGGASLSSMKQIR